MALGRAAVDVGKHEASLPPLGPRSRDTRPRRAQTAGARARTSPAAGSGTPHGRAPTPPAAARVGALARGMKGTASRRALRRSVCTRQRWRERAAAVGAGTAGRCSAARLRGLRVGPALRDPELFTSDVCAFLKPRHTSTKGFRFSIARYQAPLFQHVLDMRH